MKERYPTYARVGLTETEEMPVGEGNPFDPTPDECIVPWFVASDEATVLESWLGPYLQHAMIARDMIQTRHPNLRFSSVRIGEISTEKGSRAPIVWATLGPSSRRP